MSPTEMILSIILGFATNCIKNNGFDTERTFRNSFFVLFLNVFPTNDGNELTATYARIKM